MTELRFIEPIPIKIEFFEKSKGVQIIDSKPSKQVIEGGSPTVVNIFNDGDPTLEPRVAALENEPHIIFRNLPNLP